MTVKLTEDVFGCFVGEDGEVNDVRSFTLENSHIKMLIMNYGATLVSLKVKNSDRKFDDIVLGYNDISYYIKDQYYFGSTIGRFANRIAKGKFFIQDKLYSLAINNGPNHLHGGNKGFNKVLWNYTADYNKVTFFYTSPAMEENYPGELKCSVTYELTNNEVILYYEATTTERTPINLTNHSYFNLGGHDSGPVYDHLITIEADNFTPVDENAIPTGIIQPVASTALDLRKPTQISCILNEMPDGIDHNFCVNGAKNTEKKVARVEHPKSGRIMEIYSTQPGVQLYTANFLPEDNSLMGKDGKYYRKHGALCLETQNYPDAVNHMNFPEAILDVGAEYKHITRFYFSAKEL